MSAQHTPGQPIALVLRNLRNGICSHRHATVRYDGEIATRAIHDLLEVQHDLTEALQALLEEVEESTKYRGWDNFKQGQKKARAAIAKATGSAS